VRPEPTCPRCDGELRAPGLWASSWQCGQHGTVHPYSVVARPGPEALSHVLARAKVPVWLPHPMLPGWVQSGFGYAGDDRDGARAVASSLTGPSPLGGAGEMLIVAEEPGVGLGARYAGLPGPDPGAGFGAGQPDAKVEAAGHPTPLWNLAASSDCAVFVGEAKGQWLWALVWPAAAGVLLYDSLALDDLRDGYVEAELAFGSVSPRLSGLPQLGAGEAPHN
jgi:hypothetical protein